MVVPLLGITSCRPKSAHSLTHSPYQAQNDLLYLEYVTRGAFILLLSLSLRTLEYFHTTLELSIALLGTTPCNANVFTMSYSFRTMVQNTAG